MPQDQGVPPSGSGFCPYGSSLQAVSPVPASIPNAEAFTNAKFAYIVSMIARDFSDRTHDLAYGMWNPLFCAADASETALQFFDQAIGDLQYWRDYVAQAIEARRAIDSVAGVVEDESAVAATSGDAS